MIIAAGRGHSGGAVMGRGEAGTGEGAAAAITAATSASAGSAGPEAMSSARTNVVIIHRGGIVDTTAAAAVPTDTGSAGG